MDQYISYDHALTTVGLDCLIDRREQLCLKFAKKSLKSEKFKNWFKLNTRNPATRQVQSKFCEVYSRLDRYETSPISYLTQLLNSDMK